MKISSANVLVRTRIGTYTVKCCRVFSVAWTWRSQN